MATKKDLVEAHAFSRRRLVTAFVSGAPGGREVEPVRPGRVIIGGVALSVLLLAGAAVAGFLIGRPPAEWLEKGSFVISKDTGEQYVVLRDEPELQRVPNYVSAQLLLGEAELTPYTVRDKYIRDVKLGEDLGIEGAPASLPSADELIEDGWTACAAEDRGIKITVREGRDVEDVAGTGFLVSHEDQRWLIAPSPDVDGEPGTAYRLRLPANEGLADTVVDELGFGTTPATEVEEEWLNLFPRGGNLDRTSFGVPAGGGPVDYADSGDLSGLQVGDLVEEPEGQRYLLGTEGPQALNAFAAEVYEGLVGEALLLDEGLRIDRDEAELPGDWPAEVPESVQQQTLCAVLHPGEGTEPPTRTLAVNPGESAAPDAELGPGEHDVDVEPSGGAYVHSSSDTGTGEGTPYVIDSKGERYELAGIEVPDYIGYGGVAPAVVPSTWLTFFEPGVLLSTNRARHLPDNAPPPADEAEGS